MLMFFLLTGNPTKYSDAVGICFCITIGLDYFMVRTAIAGFTTVIVGFTMVIGSSCLTIIRG